MRPRPGSRSFPNAAEGDVRCAPGADDTDGLLPTKAPRNTLGAGLEAAVGKAAAVSSHGRCTRDSPQAEPSAVVGAHLSWPRLSRISEESLQWLQSGPDASERKLRHDGLFVNANELVVGVSHTLDVFKGFLVVLMCTSNVIITMSSSSQRSESFASLLICNFAAAQCFVGFMVAFGYSCYRQYLREWPDPPRKDRLRVRVFRAIFLPVLGAWVCNFAWCFICLKNEPTKELMIAVFTFTRVFGNGPDFLLGFSINLTLAYVLWRPLVKLVKSIRPGTHPYRNWRRDAVALGVVMAPMFLALFPVTDCTGGRRWVQWLLVCKKRDIDTPNLPALPHLADFGIGILLAAVFDRFVGELRPVGNGGIGGGLHFLQWGAARQWSVALLTVAIIALSLFVPLGQVFLHEDLSIVQMSTPFGQLVRGFSCGPSLLWLLSTLWPVAVCVVSSALLVAFKSIQYGVFLRWPLAWLEHLGANVLYCLVVIDIFLAGLFRGFMRVDPFPFTLPHCLLCVVVILAFARFLHYAARTSRK